MQALGIAFIVTALVGVYLAFMYVTRMKPRPQKRD